MLTTLVDCVDLDAERDFLVGELGFRIRLVSPADDPRRLVLERDGQLVELRRAPVDAPARLRLEAPAAEASAGGDGPVLAGTITSPGGTTVELVPVADELDLAELAPTLSVVDGAGADDPFVVGRAGMGYRDLLPDRWGGRFVASHIRIDDGGDVADWVHFHRIRFQVIFVASGWVDLVYEDQGEPFRLERGDCVLQPPEIRHRVLRSSPGLEVIEIGCPAEHDTLADHDLELPTATLDPARDFGGQRFARHHAVGAETSPWADPALRARDTGIGAATDGLAGVIVVSAPGTTTDGGARLTHDGEFAMAVGLEGEAWLDVEGHGPIRLGERTAVALPAGTVWSWRAPSAGHEALVVTLPDGSIRPA